MTGSDKEETESEDGKLPPALRADPEAKTYIYRDFANLPDDPDSDDSPPPKRCNSESSIRVQKFPVKLYAILSQKEFSDIVTWMPHGRSWKVLKPNLFESLVMPLFFEYSNYHSFNRLVNAWSFRRLSSGPDRGSYYHELFLRGKPHLQKHMRRLPKTHKKLVMKKQDEPDFYKMDKESPLPPLPEAPPNVLAMRRQAMTQAAAINNAASLNPALSARLPSSVPGYGSLVASRPSLDSFAAGGLEQQAAAARYAALDHSRGLPSSMAPLGAASLPSAASIPSSAAAAASLPSSSYLSSAAASLPPTAASLRAGRASLGMPLPSAGFSPSSLPPHRGLVAPPPPPPQHPLESSDPVAAQHYQYQRMRHLQHLQMFQRQMDTGVPPLPPGTSAADEELLRQYQAYGGAGGAGSGGAGGSLGRGRPPYM